VLQSHPLLNTRPSTACGRVQAGTVHGVARRTKIIATIGPASADEATLIAMMRAGMNVARIALAHTPLDEALERHQRIRDVADRLGLNIGTMIDLPGSKVRTGRFPFEGVELSIDDMVTLVSGTGESTAEQISIDYAHLVDDCHVGDEILVGGSVVLTVHKVQGQSVTAKVTSSGPLSGRAGVHIPFGTTVYRPVTSFDREALDKFVEVGVDMVAISVNSGRDLRELALEPHPRGPMVIAKIETMAAVENLSSIIEDAAGIMVERGGLGLEANLEDLPHIQKSVISECIAGGLPVITAAQMLDSMVKAQAPTRAEVTDIANAVFDGTSAVMLSAETAIGEHPVLVVETMARIAERSDDQFNHQAWAERVAALRMAGHEHSDAAITDAMTIAAARASEELSVRALLCISASGFTVRSMARFRPSAQILGFSGQMRTVRQLASSWGVTPIYFEGGTADYEERVRLAVNQARREGHVATGDLIGVVAGIASVARATDTFRMMRVP
jgi:pyruvate kinase